MVRFIVSLLLGAVATFLLFAFMAYLISGGDGRKDVPPPTPPIEIVTTPPDSDVDTRRRTPPPPPPPPQQPPQTPQAEPDTSSDGLNFNPDFGDVEISTDTGLGTGGLAVADGDATPIVRINPRYPPAAARDGLEGWVMLRFTIDETGGVTDVEVINSEPRRVFDQEARRALLRWKYKPKVVDGKPVRQPGQTVQLDFKLDME